MRDEAVRRDLVAAAELAADHLARRRSDRVAGPVDTQSLAERVAAFDFAQPRPTEEVAAQLFDLLRDTGVRSDHPRYFGLFNPPALPAGIVGDLVAGAVNPQLAVHSHAPAAAAIEQHLIQLFCDRIWGPSEPVGTFTSGGSEANHTALLAALARRHPDWAEHGVRAIDAPPRLYVSAEAHMAWIKIARAAGLGSDAVRKVPCRDGLSLDGTALAAAIAEDREGVPLLIAATAGTTAHGSIDRLAELAEVARRHDAHFHVDAAWAGGMLLAPRRRDLLQGLELADSVTIDPHKWLAVPMGCGLYLARDWGPLERAFGVATGYMPSASRRDRDAYIHSLQWSRRFMGAKLFVTLAALGLPGYEEMIERQLALGDRLRDKLADAGFAIVNDTTLPLVCFRPAGADDAAMDALARSVADGGVAWLSAVDCKGARCLRACITSFESDADDVDFLVSAVTDAWRRHDRD